uniref:Uncharacterized protein n=1 Tax=Zea mays TaxID=4577 RepID=C0PNK7_MAIZE|nr:unknown [Zea mays]
MFFSSSLHLVSSPHSAMLRMGCCGGDRRRHRAAPVADRRPRGHGVHGLVHPPEREPLAVALHLHAVVARREHPRDHAPLQRLPVADAGVLEPAFLHALPPPGEGLVPLEAVRGLERHRVADLPREHLLRLGPRGAGVRQPSRLHGVERRGVVPQRAREPRLPPPGVEGVLVLAQEEDGGARAAREPEEVGHRGAGLVAEQAVRREDAVHGDALAALHVEHPQADVLEAVHHGVELEREPERGGHAPQPRAGLLQLLS